MVFLTYEWCSTIVTPALAMMNTNFSVLTSFFTMCRPEQRELASGIRYGVKTASSVLELASARVFTSDYNNVGSNILSINYLSMKD